jgi:hypothetical protein
MKNLQIPLAAAVLTMLFATTGCDEMRFHKYAYPGPARVWPTSNT